MLVLLKRNFFWNGKLYERSPEGTEVEGITKKDLPSDAKELSEKIVIDPKKEGDEAIALSQLGKKAPGKPLGT
jgi:hypothetical protein